MPARFFRVDTDRTQSDVPLDGLFAGPFRSACWLIGGGPSLSKLRVREIAASPLPKMCINLAGSRVIRPTFWTSYDPSVRFHRSTYLDGTVMKFVHRRRAMDWVPETNFKVCECPNLYFFERDSKRGFADLLSGDDRIVDWADSMVQAIDILYRLGFRIIYLAGCEMRIRPSHAQIEYAAERGVPYRPSFPLRDFLSECDRQGIGTEELDRLGPGRQYHFAEWKPIRSAANTDYH